MAIGSSCVLALAFVAFFFKRKEKKEKKDKKMKFMFVDA
jgi:hypothetical protein